MRFTIKTNVSLDSTEDCLQSKTILTALTFDENKKRNQIIYYKDIEEIKPNKHVNLSSIYPYIGFILVKFSKVERKWFQYPVVLIDTNAYNTNKCVTISTDFIKSLPFGDAWKQSLEFNDFTNDKFLIEDDIYYFTTENHKQYITDENFNKIVFDFV